MLNWDWWSRKNKGCIYGCGDSERGGLIKRETEGLKVVEREACMKELGSSCMGPTMHKLAFVVK